MLTRKTTVSKRSKGAMLRGVYEENLKIASDRYEPAQAARRESRRNPHVWLVLTAFLAVGLGLSVFSGKKSESPVSVVDRRQEQTVSSAPLPAIEIEVPVPVPVPFEKSTPPVSYVLMPSESIGFAPLNQEELLDYSLILNNDQVRLSAIFGLDVQTIVIDPGHGGKDPGAIGVLKTKEKDIVLDIAGRLQKKLKQSGKYNVLLTRGGDSTVSLAERVDFANVGRTDLFISLHVNALPQKKINVTETYYYGPPSDSETLRLAEQENRGSGVLTKDFEEMIKKIGNTFKEQESVNLASAIQYSLFTNVKKYDKDIADAGIKYAPFVVLLGVDAPSVLVEISCISKKQEELKLNMPAYRNEITSFLAEGIINYLAKRNIHFVKGDENGEKERS